jgi:MFS family permease
MAGFGISATSIGLLLASSSAVKCVGFYYAERIVKFGTRKGLFLGPITMAISLVVVGYASTDIAFFIPMVLFGAGNGLIEPLLMNSIAHGSPKASLGTTMGLYEGVYGSFTCISPLAAGYFTEVFSASTIYVTLAAISFLMIPTARKMLD